MSSISSIENWLKSLDKKFSSDKNIPLYTQLSRLSDLLRHNNTSSNATHPKYSPPTGKDVKIITQLLKQLSTLLRNHTGDICRQETLAELLKDVLSQFKSNGFLNYCTKVADSVEEQTSTLLVSNYYQELNRLFSELLSAMKLILDKFSSDSPQFFSILDKINQSFGFVLIGNLSHLDAALLKQASWLLVSFLVNRQTSTQSSSSPNVEHHQSVPLYTTLSHLAFKHSIWLCHTQNTNDSTAADPVLKGNVPLCFSMLEVFVGGLEGILATDGQNNMGVKESVVISNQTSIVACINGLSQLAIRSFSSLLLLPNSSKTAGQNKHRHLLLLIRSVGAVWPLALTFNPFRKVNLDDRNQFSSNASANSSCTSSSSSCESEDGSSDKQLNIDDAIPHINTTNQSSVDLHSRTFNSKADGDNASSRLNTPTTRPDGSHRRSADHKVDHRSSRRHNHRRRHHHVQRTGLPKLDSQAKLYANAVFALDRFLFALRSYFRSSNPQTNLQHQQQLWNLLINNSQGDNFSSSSSMTSELADSLIEESFRMNIGPSSLSPDLITLVYRTRDDAIRQLLVGALNNLLSIAGKTFTAASDLTKKSLPSSFIPLSVKLACQLRQLHSRLSLLLLTERSANVKVQLLKAIITLAHHSPYQQLKPSGLLDDLLPFIRHALTTQSSTVEQPTQLPSSTTSSELRSCCLQLIATLLDKPASPIGSNNSSEMTSVLTFLLSGGDCGQANDPSIAEPSSQPSWLLTTCLQLLKPTNVQQLIQVVSDDQVMSHQTRFEPMSIRISVLDLLKALLVNHHHQVILLTRSDQQLSELQALLVDSIKKSSTGDNFFLTPLLRFLVLFFISTKRSRLEDDTLASMSHSWWSAFLPHLLTILQDSDASLGDRTLCCQIIQLFDIPSMNILTKNSAPDTFNVQKIADVLYTTAQSSNFILSARCYKALSFFSLNSCLATETTNVQRMIHYILSIPIHRIISDTNSQEDIAWTLSNCCLILAWIFETMPSSSNLLPRINWIELIKLCCSLCSTSNTKNLSLSSCEPQCGGDHRIDCRLEEREEVDDTDRDGNHPLVVDKESTTTTTTIDTVKSTRSSSCERAACSIGYLLRLASPQLFQSSSSNIDWPDLFDKMITTICSAMTYNDGVNNAEKIRWNANASVGCLFRNAELVGMLRQLLSHQTNVPQLTNEKIYNGFCLVINHLCTTLTQDAYFKSRVQAALSLLEAFHGEEAVLRLTSHAWTTHQCFTNGGSFSLFAMPLTSILQSSCGALSVNHLDSRQSSSTCLSDLVISAQTKSSELRYEPVCSQLSLALLCKSLSCLIIFLEQACHTESCSCSIELLFELSDYLYGWLTKDIIDCLADTIVRRRCEEHGSSQRPEVRQVTKPGHQLARQLHWTNNKHGGKSLNHLMTECVDQLATDCIRWQQRSMPINPFDQLSQQLQLAQLVDKSVAGGLELTPPSTNTITNFTNTYD